jgi:hypothetical protein
MGFRSDGIFARSYSADLKGYDGNTWANVGEDVDEADPVMYDPCYKSFRNCCVLRAF